MHLLFQKRYSRLHQVFKYCDKSQHGLKIRIRIVVFTHQYLRTPAGGSMTLFRASIDFGKSKSNISSLNQNILSPTRLSRFWLAKWSSEPSKFKIIIFFLNTLAVSISARTFIQDASNIFVILSLDAEGIRS